MPTNNHSKGQTLSRRVYDHLVGEMAAQRMPPGHRLNTSQIARGLGVSRTTVLTAVARLVDAGWIQSDGGRHPVVVALPKQPAQAQQNHSLPAQNGIEHVNQTDTTYRAILERVLRGDFCPGEIVKAKPLADELSVSYSTIRQALEWLCQEGVFVRVPRRGWRFEKLTLRDTMNINRIRLRLEPMAIKGVIRKISQQQLDRLFAETDRMIAMDGKDSPKLDHRRYDYEFHRTLLEISGNRMLLETLDTILRKLLLTVWFERVSRRETYIEHRQILEAIQQRDTRQAVERQRAHLRSALKKCVAAWE